MKKKEGRERERDVESAHSKRKTSASSTSSTSGCPGNLSVSVDSRVRTHLDRTAEVGAAFNFWS